MMSTRGRQSARAPIEIGRRHKRSRKPGKKELKGLEWRRQESEVLDVVVAHFEEVYQQLTEQMKLITTLQQKVRRLIPNR